MKHKKKYYLYIILILFSIENNFSQEIKLKITSIHKNENTILKKINYINKHNNKENLINELVKVSNYLKEIGYLTNTIDSLTKNNTAFLSLHEKIEVAKITFNETTKGYVKKHKLNNNNLTIPFIRVKALLKEITNQLDKKGNSFAKVKLTDIKISNKTLVARIEITKKEKRKINNVKIKGYKDFPQKYLKNHLNITKDILFNNENISRISEKTKSIPFIQELKSPEALFTKDSTLLYLFLKKIENNSFEGIVSFNSNENGNGKLVLNGNIDLKLNNIFNTGEKISINWESTGDKKQELDLKTEIPYIFNTKFSPQINFSIYKQDSTFVNTKLDSKLFYSINSKTRIALTYNTETSLNLKKIDNSSFEKFNNFFIGLEYQYKITKNDIFLNDKFNLQINPTIGKRKSEINNSNQFKIEASTSYIFDINTRNSIYTKNKTGYLNSDNLLNNELFRIGGTNSIRGFNEQNIFTNNYTYFNIEFRRLTSNKSYVYSITDVGRINKENLLGIGIGYLFKVKKSLINIGYVIGKGNKEKFTYSNSKLMINWVTLF